MTPPGKQRYEMECTRLRTQRQLRAAGEALAQAESDLYLSKDALLNYETGLRVWLDRFSGRKAEKLEQLQSEIRRTQAHRDACRRERDAIQLSLREQDAALSALPGWSELNAPDWEARACAAMLGPMLEDNYEALKEARKSLRGERTGELMSREQFQEIYAAADRTGEDCAALAARLHALGHLPDLPPYYRGPTAYVATAATSFSRLDRVNNAMDQNLELRSALTQILTGNSDTPL